MTKERRVQAGTSTHSDEKVKQPGASEFTVKNSGVAAQMLIDPEDDTSGSTYSADPVKVKNGVKKVPTTAAITDAELDGPLNVHNIPNDVDPAAGYLDTGDSLPMISVGAVEGEDDDEEFTGDEDDTVEAEFDDEFADLPAIEEASDEGEFEEGGDLVDEVAEESFEAPADESETVALLDADEVADGAEASEDLQFATVANLVHVIRSNRIIASMGLAAAKRAEAADVYLTPQFQDVVTANIESKGLRKGLVQSGFVLARVKLAAASKATTRAVTAKVEAGVAKRIALLAAREKAMEQSLAIAAVGINRRFFKDTTNELKANLEAELTQLGVRGGQNLVRAMFAKYGVSYAKSILTLANKISAMPEEMRDSYAEALDMTDDGEDFASEVDSELDVADEGDFVEDGDEDEFDPIPASTVSASLLHTPRRGAALLQAGVKTSAAMSILNGSQSLV